MGKSRKRKSEANSKMILEKVKEKLVENDSFLGPAFPLLNTIAPEQSSEPTAYYALTSFCRFTPKAAVKVSHDRPFSMAFCSSCM